VREAFLAARAFLRSRFSADLVFAGLVEGWEEVSLTFAIDVEAIDVEGKEILLWERV
jgi:hypothetical protein